LCDHHLHRRGDRLGDRLPPHARTGGSQLMADTTLRMTSRRPAPRRRPSLLRWFAATGWRHLVGIVTVLFAIFPLVYVLSASLNPSGTLVGPNQLLRTIDLGNYVDLF